MTALEPKGALHLPNRVDGLDVSEFQPQIDYAKVAANGFRFAAVRCAIGPKGRDWLALKHLAGFRAAGMYTLVYVALSPSKGDAGAQVRNLWDALGDVASGPLLLDLETRNSALSNRVLVDFLEDGVQAAEACTLLGAGIYSFPDYFRHLQPELGQSKLGRASLWSACIAAPVEPWTPPWGFTPYIPAPWTSWQLHQYSGGKGFPVPGVVGPCDRDLFNGDEPALRRWLGLPDIHEADTLPALPTEDVT